MPEGDAALRLVKLAGPDDVDGLLAALARLVESQTAPEVVVWDHGQPRQAGLFDGAAAKPVHEAEGRYAHDRPARPRWPGGFARLVRDAGLHDDPDRHLALHRLAAALHRDPRAWQDTLRPDRLVVERMAREVRHEVHRMHAFVRFRPVVADGVTEHVAWYDPAHHVVRAAAPFFQKRFASMRWAILTPRGSVAWDLRELRFGPPAHANQRPAADEGEAMWLAYYRSIFNPARANAGLLRQHIPVRYWGQLSEAATFAPLLGAATQTTHAMIEHAADTERRLPRRESAPGEADAGEAVRMACHREEPVHPMGADERRQRLRQLAAHAARCDRCPGAQMATQTVFGRGSPTARVMLVGEQPGDREDLAGRPFVGPAGQLLQHAVQALGWPLQQLYVTNAVKHFHYTVRGPRRLHKTPAQQELAACLDWLEAEIATVDPAAIVALGQTAARALLGGALDTAMGPAMGTATGLEAGGVPRRDDGRPVWIAWHPSALLRAGVGLADAALHQHPRFQVWLAQLAGAGTAFDLPEGRPSRGLVV